VIIDRVNRTLIALKGNQPRSLSSLGADGDLHGNFCCFSTLEEGGVSGLCHVNCRKLGVSSIEREKGDGLKTDRLFHRPPTTMHATEVFRVIV